MNQQTYRKITDGIRRLENGEKIVQFINSIATKIVYMAYVVGIIILFDEKNKGLARFVAVTAISFILVSIVRRFINSERPYTMYDFKPIIEKNKKGESMPSRHVFFCVYHRNGFSLHRRDSTWNNCFCLRFNYCNCKSYKRGSFS